MHLAIDPVNKRQYPYQVNGSKKPTLEVAPRSGSNLDVRPSPHCAAPYGPSGGVGAVLAAVQRKMDMLIDHSLAPATRKTYDSAVNQFLNFTKTLGLTRSQSLPCSDQLLCLFLSSGAGQRGSSYAKALVSGIRSWHVRNGYNWTPSLRLQLVIRGLDSLRLRNRGNKKARLPVTPRMVHILVEAWRKGSNKEKCALACALTAWFGQLRLGEILPSNAREIDLSRLPKRSDWQIIGNLNKSSKLHLPWTKTQRWDGDVVHLVEQNRHFNATQAIKRHLNSSQLNMREPLCAYLEGTHTVIMNKKVFMHMCNEIWSHHGFDRYTGHSFRIGGTTMLLRAGVEPDVVKKMGRWKSDAFVAYWRELDAIFTHHAANLEAEEW
ncbi:hypothetical protein CPB86DRAFT_862866 [Serendipita vermifera]|nr:hypothetical protein CPB86DRAFT_862866 [Serendipita vermifera]